MLQSSLMKPNKTSKEMLSILQNIQDKRNRVANKFMAKPSSDSEIDYLAGINCSDVERELEEERLEEEKLAEKKLAEESENKERNANMEELDSMEIFQIKSSNRVKDFEESTPKKKLENIKTTSKPKEKNKTAKKESSKKKTTKKKSTKKVTETIQDKNEDNSKSVIEKLKEKTEKAFRTPKKAKKTSKNEISPNVPINEFKKKHFVESEDFEDFEIGDLEQTASEEKLPKKQNKNKAIHKKTMRIKKGKSYRKYKVINKKDKKEDLSNINIPKVVKKVQKKVQKKTHKKVHKKVQKKVQKPVQKNEVSVENKSEFVVKLIKNSISMSRGGGKTRPRRQRVRPLKHWLGEKPKYGKNAVGRSEVKGYILKNEKEQKLDVDKIIKNLQPKRRPSKSSSFKKELDADFFESDFESEIVSITENIEKNAEKEPKNKGKKRTENIKNIKKANKISKIGNKKEKSRRKVENIDKNQHKKIITDLKKDERNEKNYIYEKEKQIKVSKPEKELKPVNVLKQVKQQKKKNKPEKKKTIPGSLRDRLKHKLYGSSEDLDDFPEESIVLSDSNNFGNIVERSIGDESILEDSDEKDYPLFIRKLEDIEMKKIEDGASNENYSGHAFNFKYSRFEYFSLPPSSKKTREICDNKKVFVVLEAEKGVQLKINKWKTVIKQGNSVFIPKGENYQLENLCKDKTVRLWFWSSLDD